MLVQPRPSQPQRLRIDALERLLDIKQLDQPLARRHICAPLDEPLNILTCNISREDLHVTHTTTSGCLITYAATRRAKPVTDDKRDR